MEPEAVEDDLELAVIEPSVMADDHDIFLPDPVQHPGTCLPYRKAEGPLRDREDRVVLRLSMDHSRHDLSPAASVG
jgi:hypothetical protein